MWWYLRARLLLWLLRGIGRVLRWAVLAAVLTAAAPVTIVAAVGFGGAWLRGVAADEAAPRGVLVAADDRCLSGRAGVTSPDTIRLQILRDHECAAGCATSARRR